MRHDYRQDSASSYRLCHDGCRRALYKGSVPALMLVSHGGIQFVTYEFMKGHFTDFFTANNGKGSGGGGGNQWNMSSGKSKGTIGERLRDSLGYLVMGAVSKL